MFAGILLYTPKHNFTSRSLLSSFCPLCSSCVSRVAPRSTKVIRRFQEKIFGLSIFLFAQNLWRAVMKNGNLYDTLTAGEVNRRFTTSPAFSKEPQDLHSTFLFAYSTNLAPLNFCIGCRRYRAKRRCDTEDITHLW